MLRLIWRRTWWWATTLSELSWETLILTWTAGTSSPLTPSGELVGRKWWVAEPNQHRTAMAGIGRPAAHATVEGSRTIPPISCCFLPGSALQLVAISSTSTVGQDGMPVLVPSRLTVFMMANGTMPGWSNRAGTPQCLYRPRGLSGLPLRKCQTPRTFLPTPLSHPSSTSRSRYEYIRIMLLRRPPMLM